MLRDYNSARSQKWFNRNSLSNPSCKEYVQNILGMFGISSYKIDIFDTDKYSLWITYGTHSYVISTSAEEVALITYERIGNLKKEQYHKVLGKRFCGDRCWYDCISWIKNREI